MLLVMWMMVGLVIGLYVLFIVWRIRADRRKKAMREDPTSTMSSTLARAATDALRREPVAPPEPLVSREPMPRAETSGIPAMPAPTSMPVPPPARAGEPTVADALHGIALPNDLAPLTTMAERGGTGDRVAFWTDAPVEVVGPAFGDELERLGYTVNALDQQTLAAQRDGTRLIAIIHRDANTVRLGEGPAFPSVPEAATVIEIWVAL